MGRKARTVADVLADTLKRHGVTFTLGQSVPSAVVLACEGNVIPQITYRQENMGGARTWAARWLMVSLVSPVGYR